MRTMSKCQAAILPADTGSDDAQRLVLNTILLVEHQEIGRSSTRRQRFLSVVDGPLQLLNSDEDLAKQGIDSRFTAVKASDAYNVILVVEDESVAAVSSGTSTLDVRLVLQQSPEQSSPFPEPRLCPTDLSLRGALDHPVDAVGRDWVDPLQELAGRWTVALDGCRARDLAAVIRVTFFPLNTIERGAEHDPMQRRKGHGREALSSTYLDGRVVQDFASRNLQALIWQWKCEI